MRHRRWRPVLLAAALTALPACGHSRQAAPTRVAILPLDSVGLPAPAVERLRQALGQQVARAPTLTRLPLEEVEAATRRAAGCQPLSRERWVPCATRVGGELQAAQAVVGAVGGLGSTYVVQLHLVGVKTGAVIRSLEETLFGNPARLESAVGNITTRLFDLPRPQRWYERWWVWTLAGVAVATAVAVPLALRDSDPYQNVPLP
jgi:hypothetical protein